MQSKRYGKNKVAQNEHRRQLIKSEKVCACKEREKSRRTTIEDVDLPVGAHPNSRRRLPVLLRSVVESYRAPGCTTVD